MTLNEAYQTIVENPKKHYCYVLRDGMVPFYVGIGRGRRIREHSYEVTSYFKGTHGAADRANLQKIHKIKRLEDSGVGVDYCLVGFYDTWEEACEVEIELIEFIGRQIHGGPLLNLTDGGEGAAGRPASEKQKAAVRRANSKPKSRESIQKMMDTKTATGTWTKSFLGKTHTEEWRKAMSERMTGENNPNYGKRGEDCPNYGRTHSEETRKLISQKVRQYWEPLVEMRLSDKEDFDKNLHGPFMPPDLLRVRNLVEALSDKRDDPERTAQTVVSQILTKKDGAKSRLEKYIDDLIRGEPSTQSKYLLKRLKEDEEYTEKFLQKLIQLKENIVEEVQ